MHKEDIKRCINVDSDNPNKDKTLFSTTISYGDHIFEMKQVQSSILKRKNFD